jgi:hypothetical protein
VETQSIISEKIAYLSQDELVPLETRLDDLRKMLKSLSNRLA